MPGFEATLKMLDIASDVSTGAVEHARESLKTIGVWTAVTMVGLFLIEYPLVWMNGKRQALSDYLAEMLSGDTFGLASFYSHAKIHQPGEVVGGVAAGPAHYNPTLSSIPSCHLRWCRTNAFDVRYRLVHEDKSPFLVNLGTIVGWFFLVPLAVAFNLPVYEGQIGASVPLQDYLLL